MKRTRVEGLLSLGALALCAATLPECALSHPVNASGRYRLSMTLVSRGPAGIERQVVDSGQDSFRWTDAANCDGSTAAMDQLRATWSGRVRQKLESIAANGAGTTDLERMRFGGRTWCLADVATHPEGFLDRCTMPTEAPALPVEACPEESTGALFSVAPTEVVFPDTRIGASASATVVVRNIGTAPLHFAPFAGIEWMEAGFELHGGAAGRSCVEGTPPTVPPMGSCELSVTFRPLVARSFRGALRFDTDGRILVNRVRLRGAGTAAP